MNKSQIKELLEKYKVPAHVQKHMHAVKDIAVYLGKKLIKNGTDVNLKLLEQAALLHDLVKISHKENHETAAYQILTGIGEPILAEIVKKHAYLSLAAKKEDKPTTWEEKLIYYADKRVLHDKVVSIKERIEDGRTRYFKGKITKEDKNVEKTLFELEAEICTYAKIKPEDIKGTLLKN